MTDTVNSSQAPTTDGQDDPVVDGEKHRSFQSDQAFIENYPDGGLRAWLVIAGAAASTFSTFGYVNAWGSFQSYYEKTLLVDSDASTIAWIGSIQYALILLPGLLTGRMFDLGYFQLPNFLASVVLVVATFLIAECTKYWHFLLCQGIAVGFACGIIFGPTMGVVGHWFKRRRAIALGVTACGSSLGGTVFPIIASKLIPLIGFPWTVRTIGFILVVACGFSNLAMKRRLPPRNVEGGLLNLAAFKNPCYSIYAASSLAAFLGLYTLLTYIDVSATFYGVSPTISFYLLSIANFSSGFGRIVTGVVSGRTGAVNFIVPMTFIAGVLTYAWPFAHSFGTMVVIAILYGFSSGAYISSFMLPLFEMGEIGDIGRRTGMVLSIAALGAVAGPPISGAINTATGGYNAVGYYAGSTIMLAVTLMLITRHLALRKFVGKY